MEETDFAYALRKMKHQGAQMKRLGWNGPDQKVELQMTDENSKMTQPYFYIRNQQGGLVPWVPSQGDLLATDWIEA